MAWVTGKRGKKGGRDTNRLGGAVLLANVCDCCSSWKLGRPLRSQPQILPKACGWLPTFHSLLFRHCLCNPIKQWRLLPRLAHLATVSFWVVEGCIKVTEQVSGYFLLLLSRLGCFSTLDTPILINYQVCFARHFSALYRILFFFLKGKSLWDCTVIKTQQLGAGECALRYIFLWGFWTDSKVPWKVAWASGLAFSFFSGCKAPCIGLVWAS